jgi:hypothetical protein
MNDLAQLPEVSSSPYQNLLRDRTPTGVPFAINRPV